MSAFAKWEQQLMDKLADMPAAEALARGLVKRCPTCGTLHPGIRFGHVDHREYCSTDCFRNRSEK